MPATQATTIAERRKMMRLVISHPQPGGKTF